jgi:hypothetical protein
VIRNRNVDGISYLQSLGLDDQPSSIIRIQEPFLFPEPIRLTLRKAPSFNSVENKNMAIANEDCEIGFAREGQCCVRTINNVLRFVDERSFPSPDSAEVQSNSSGWTDESKKEYKDFWVSQKKLFSLNDVFLSQSSIQKQNQTFNEYANGLQQSMTDPEYGS